MKYIYLLLLFLIPAKGFSQKSFVDLESAYEKNAEPALLNLLNNWAKLIPEMDAEELKNSTKLEQEAYHIFEAFYQPKKLSQYQRFPSNTVLHEEKDFLILQNELSILEMDKIYATNNDIKEYMFKKLQMYSIHDTSRTNSLLRQINDNPLSDKLVFLHPYRQTDDTSGIIEKHLIKNFRPKVNLSKTKLYLTPNYKDELDEFLKYEGVKKNAAEAYNERTKRLTFLNKKLNILPSRMYWHLVSNPEVYRMQINKEFTNAKVDFRIGHGGDAILIKENGKWVFKYAISTWVS